MRKSVCGLPVSRLARRDRRLAPRRHDLDALARPPRRPEAHADEAPGDAQLLGLRVLPAEREQLLHVVPAHEEVDVLRRAAEQLVAQRSADLVELAERQLRHADPHLVSGPARGHRYSTVTVFARFRG